MISIFRTASYVSDAAPCTAAYAIFLTVVLRSRARVFMNRIIISE